MLVKRSRDRRRSPASKKLINALPRIDWTVAGTGLAAGVRVSERGTWADVILTVEHGHLRRLRNQFGEVLTGNVIHCLDVPDDYE